MSASITYRQEGDYLLPNLIVQESPKIGVWGERRRRFLREHQRGIYSGLLLSGRLNAHLEEVDRSAEKMFFHLVKDMAEKGGITEGLKAANQMEWVQRMNTIRAQAQEIVETELIYQ